MNRCLLLRTDPNTRDEKKINQSLQIDETVRPASAVKDVVVEPAHVCCPSAVKGGRKAGILHLPPIWNFPPPLSLHMPVDGTSTNTVVFIWVAGSTDVERTPAPF